MSDLATKPDYQGLPSLEDLFPEAASRRQAPDPFRILDETKRGIILKVLDEGLPLDVACARALISLKTVSMALTKAAPELEAYELYGLPLTPRAEFLLRVQQYRALAKTKFRKKMYDIADQDPRAWGAIAHVEAVLDPLEFGKKATVQIQQDLTFKVEFEERGGAAWQTPGRDNATLQRAITGIVGGDDVYDPSEVIDTTLDDLDEASEGDTDDG